MIHHSPWYYIPLIDRFVTEYMKQKDFYLVHLGEQIRKFRKDLGLSQEQLALKAEVDRSYMGSIERGERNVSYLTLVKITNQLKCTVSELTSGIPNGQ